MKNAGLKTYGVLAVIGVILGAADVRAAPSDLAAKVRAGNAAYGAGEYEKALALYDEAEVGCPECAELAYNRGLAYYRMRDFVKAREMFNSALTTRDLGLEARAKYNLGNVAYAQALEKLSAPQEAITSARQAIEYYRDALDINPADGDARANIEIAQLFIKDLLDKLKNEQEKQQQDQQQNQDQQQQEEQNQEQQQDQQQQQQQDQQQDQQQEQQQEQSGEGSQDEQQQPQQQNEGQPEEEQQEQQNASQPAQEQGGQPQEEQQAAAAEPREMNEEEVERVLQAVRDREAQRRAERARRQNVRMAPVARDW